MFAIALIAGTVLLRLFASTQLTEEVEPAARSAETIASALNAALRVSDNPQATLDAFAGSLGDREAIRFRRVGADLASQPLDVHTPLGKVPDWFVRLLVIPEFTAVYPVAIEDKPVGDIVFAPDMSADLYEKWIGLLAIAGSGVALMLLTAVIAHFTARSVLRPLQTLGDGLTRMRQGDYEKPVAAAGPPEIRNSALEANELARTLRDLSQDNRSLLRRIVSLQDDERRDMARELHDELGPLLFGIRANTVALLETMPAEEARSIAAAEGILRSVESLQQANRRVLDRLRPLYIQELGLVKSVQTMLQDAKAQAPGLQVTSHVEPALNGVDDLLSLTVYRVIQEAMTNVLRHSRAHEVHVSAEFSGRDVLVEISDDGIGFPTDRRFGRGLTGMLERVRALSGTLDLLRADGRTSVRCRLPLDGGASNGAAKNA